MCITWGSIYFLWGFNLFQAVVVIFGWELVKFLWHVIGS